MTNLEKYNKVFMDVFRKKEDEIQNLQYQKIQKWDSIGHMDLMSEMEETFDIRMNTPDVLAFTSYEKGKEILKAYGIHIEA